MNNFDLALQLLPLQLWNTVYMVCTATIFALLIGIPISIILFFTDQGGMRQNIFIYKILETIVNIGRSFPFAILMIAVIPLTRWVVGTTLGTTASIVPLTIAAAPYIARVIEVALKQVNRHVLEAAIVMGSSPLQIVLKVLFPEALPTIVSGITIAMVQIIGYSAMAGLVGGGGLGQVAIQYGYQRFNTFIMFSTVVLLILLVQSIQWLGHLVGKKISRTRGLHE